MDYVQAHAIPSSTEAHIKFYAKYSYYEYLNIARKLPLFLLKVRHNINHHIASAWPH